MKNGEFKIEVGNSRLVFQPVTLEDPVPTGQQIIKAAGFRPVEEFLAFTVTPDRCLTELGLEKTVDILKNVETRFLIFRNDRSWRVLIDGRRIPWGESAIAGRVLKWLASVNPETHGVWLERRDEPDKLIGDDEMVSLGDSGVERFRTDPLQCLLIEDKTHYWPKDTITTEEIATLGGWDLSKGVIEVDADQNERTLKPEEVVKLRPGISFGKRLRFKRGLLAMNTRIESELALLRQHFDHVEYVLENNMHWFKVQSLKMPDGWSPARIPVVFSVTEGYPGAEPYGFFVPVELNLDGTQPTDGEAPNQPPFDKSWRFLSWSSVEWQPTADLRTGSNLWNWVQTFPHRMREGV